MSPEEKRKEYLRNWVRNNPEKVRAKAARYRDKPGNREAANSKRRHKIYGLTEEEFLLMKSSQNGSCAICGSSQEQGLKRELDVDHCHSTGEIRGLLCNNCNRGIGHLQDDPDILLRAYEYLLRFKNKE